MKLDKKGKRFPREDELNCAQHLKERCQAKAKGGAQMRGVKEKAENRKLGIPEGNWRGKHSSAMQGQKLKERNEEK